MPIHDWTRENDAAFHSFQLGWASELSRRLNGGVLPAPVYAMTETVELGPVAPFCELPEPDGHLRLLNWDEGLPDATEQPPRTRFRSCDGRRQFACRVVTIRDDLHQPLAAILWATRQDKETPYRLEGLTRLAVGALTRGINLLVLDLFPSTSRNPQGIHKAIWDRIKDEPFELPPDKPLTLAAYSAGTTLTGYVENLGVGDILPDMPLFLTADRYVPCPLEATYRQSWDVFPKALKGPLEAPPSRS